MGDKLRAMFAVIHNEHVARGVHFLPFYERGCLRASKLTEIIHNSVSALNFCYEISITLADRDFVTYITDEEAEAAAPCVILQHKNPL